VVPSDRRHETLRVSVEVAEQVLVDVLNAPTLQLKEQVLKSLKVCDSAPSVPQEKVLGVQDCEAAGCVPAPPQLELSTVVPSDRRQETVCVSEPEFTLTSQLAVRVCVKLVPQPVLGANEVKSHVPLPPVQALKPLCAQVKVQPPKSATVCVVAGFVVVQKESATVTPSSRWQLTLRVCTRLEVHAVPAAGVNAPLIQVYTWPMPETVKLVADPAAVETAIVAVSVPLIEGSKLRAPLVQDCPAMRDALVHVPLEIAKSGLLLANGVAPKETGPPTAVSVTVPQVTEVLSATLPQLGMAPIEIVPLPTLCAVKLVEVPSPAVAETERLAFRLPAAAGVKITMPEVQVLPALKVTLAQVPCGIANSPELANGEAPKLTGPPTAVTISPPHVTGAPILLAAQVSVGAEAAPQPPESATVCVETGVVPVQLLLATVVVVVPSNCWHVTVRVCVRAKVQLEPAAGVNAVVL
jgi:hypothetical protein